jgi:hypothetical protein
MMGAWEAIAGGSTERRSCSIGRRGGGRALRSRALQTNVGLRLSQGHP